MSQTDSENDDKNRTSIDFEKDGWTGDRELTVKHRGDVIEIENPEMNHYQVLVFKPDGVERASTRDLDDDHALIRDGGHRILETTHDQKEVVKSTDYDIVEYKPIGGGKWTIAHGQETIREIIETFCEQGYPIAIQEQILVRVG